MDKIICPVADNAQNLPGQTAILHGRQSLNYRELHQKINSCCKKLISLGIVEKDHIGIVSKNSLEYIILAIALWRIKAISCHINPQLPIESINIQLEQCTCKMFFTNDPPISQSFQNIKSINIYHFFLDLEEGSDEFLDTNNNFTSDQELTILFTSGTSAKAKAVLHSFGNHYFNALGSNQHVKVEKGDLWLLALPLHHVSGLSILFRMFVGGGSIIVIDEQKEIPTAINDHNVTHASFVSTQIIRLIKNHATELKKLKAILLGGSALPEWIIRQAIDLRLPVYVSYGLTEMASQVATSNLIKNINDHRKAKILKNCELTLTDDGEILVKGKTLFLGYIEKSHVNSAIDDQGWFHTGDLGKLENDSLTVLGRKDNMFVSGGENIYPEEIESVMNQIHGIEQATVIPSPHAEFGERPIAFIKLTDHCAPNKNQIFDHLHKYLPKYKIPDQLYQFPGQIKTTGIKASRILLIQFTSSQKHLLSLII